MSSTHTSGRRSAAYASALPGLCHTVARWPTASMYIARICAASTLSSTIRTSSASAGAAAPVATGSSSASSLSPARRGSTTVKRLPRPVPSLCAATVPSCSSTRLFTSARPIPRPPCDRSALRSACENRSNARVARSGAMPMPVSHTSTATLARSSRTCTSMRPPSGVYFAALPRMLANTCTRRLRSPCTCASSDGRCNSRWCAFALTCGRTCSTASAMTPASGTGARSSVTRPRVTRETSSRSSISPVMWRAWRPMIAVTWRTRSSSSRPTLRKSAAAVIGASGLRSSCASIARNSSLRRSASRSACRASWIGVTSTITATPSVAGWSIVTEPICTLTRLPSLR